MWWLSLPVYLLINAEQVGNYWNGGPKGLAEGAPKLPAALRLIITWRRFKNTKQRRHAGKLSRALRAAARARSRQILIHLLSRSAPTIAAHHKNNVNLFSFFMNTKCGFLGEKGHVGATANARLVLINNLLACR
jgi:hypothetical protein